MSRIEMTPIGTLFSVTGNWAKWTRRIGSKGGGGGGCCQSNAVVSGKGVEEKEGGAMATRFCVPLHAHMTETAAQHQREAIGDAGRRRD